MKTSEIILLGSSTLIFFLYLFIIYKKYGILKSISDSYYKTNPFLFTFFIWAIVIPIIVVGNQPIMFVAGSSLAFVGAAPAFKEKLVQQVHIVGATGGIILGFLSLWLEFKMYPLPILMAIGTLYMILKPVKNYTWWIEVVAFLLIILGLILSL